MQNLPVILAVIVSAAAIIAVLFWRIKPQSAPNTEVLDKRILEETKRAEALQAKLEAKENALRTAEANFAVAKAAMDAAKLEVAAAEKRFENVQAEASTKQIKLDDALQRAATSENRAANVRQQIDDMSRTIETLSEELTAVRADHVAAVTKQQSNEAAASQFKVISQEILAKTLEEAKHGMGTLAETLQRSSDAELTKHASKVAQTLEPLQARLESYEKSIKNMEEVSHKNFGGLVQQIAELQKAEQSLHDKATALTSALTTSPKMRGNYGELTLKRLVEAVGMQENYHFEAQASRQTDAGRRIPDLVIFLPGEQKVIVDAKAVLNACIEAYDAETEEERKTYFKQHSENVKKRVIELSEKEYFSLHAESVESVVLFLPTDGLYFTALEHDPNLIEFAASKRIIICSPGSLIMLLTVANHLWRQASIEKEALEIKKCGEEIYRSACLFVEKFAEIGKRIKSLESEYNKSIGTLEGSIIKSGKRMSEFDSVSRKQEIKDVLPILDELREFKQATKQLAADTPKLPGLVIGDETAELEFSAGDK